MQQAPRTRNGFGTAKAWKHCRGTQMRSPVYFFLFFLDEYSTLKEYIRNIATDCVGGRRGDASGRATEQLLRRQERRGWGFFLPPFTRQDPSAHLQCQLCRCLRPCAPTSSRVRSGSWYCACARGKASRCTQKALVWRTWGLSLANAIECKPTNPLQYLFDRKGRLTARF
jgi:hypothetical protein